MARTHTYIVHVHVVYVGTYICFLAHLSSFVLTNLTSNAMLHVENEYESAD